MQTENTSRIPDDEIDIKSIGGKIYSFFAYPVTLLFSNILITLAFVIAAGIFSVAFKYLVPKTYTASFILRPTDIKDKVYLKVLNDVPALLRKEDTRALSGLLEIDSSLVKKLENITIYPSVKIPGDSTNTVEIEIESSDANVLLPVQSSIINYLENNPYYQKIKGLQKSQIQMNLEQIDKDLVQLDSLKKLQLAIYEKQKVSQQSTLMLNDLINPTAAYNTSSDRMVKKTSLLSQNVFIDRFILVKGCVIPSRHSWPPRILILLLFAVPFSLLLCALFLHYRSQRK